MDETNLQISETRRYDDFHERIADTYVELAKLLGRSRFNWIPGWFEAFLLPRGQHDVRLNKLKPPRSKRLKSLTLERILILQELQDAHASCDAPLIRRLTLKVGQIDAVISSISGANGGAKPGPNKSAVTSKELMAARLVELHVFLKGKEPSPRNQKLARILVSLLSTSGAVRTPIGNPLNGARKAFERALSVSGKVNDLERRKTDVRHDEIVLERLLTRRSLKNCKMIGRAPWIVPGMNGPVMIYSPQT